MSEIKSGKYRHYKGKLYEVIYVARDSETLERLVVYKALYDSEEFGNNAVWTRPFNDFIEYQKSVDPLKDLEKLKDIDQTGSLGPIAGAVANIQVMEIFKFLIGKGKTNLNRFAEIDFMDFKVEWREFYKKEV